MKPQRAITIEGVRFEPHFLAGYWGTINGKRVVVKQESDRDWVVRKNWAGYFGVGGRVIGGGRTLRDAVRMAKEKAA